MSREHILHKVRTALGRSAGQSPLPPPAVRLRVPEMDVATRIRSFFGAIEKLAGKGHRASSPSDVRAYAAELIGERSAVAANAPILAEFGITALPSVRTGILDRDTLRAACAAAEVGITGADYALADTGTLVMLSSPEEARLISLLPPVHLAIVAQDKILTSMDELLTILPRPAEQTSSMVLITGPSRTADIEQILVRGVHGRERFTWLSFRPAGCSESCC